MKRTISLVSCLTCIALVSSLAATAPAMKPAAPKPPTVQQLVKELRGPMDKRRAPFPEMIAALEQLRSIPIVATNAASRTYVDLQIIGLCRVPGWTSLKRKWSPRLAERIPAVALRSLNDAAVPFVLRVSLAEKLAEHYANERRYDEAEKVLRTLLEDPEKRPEHVDVPIHAALCDVFRWQDRFDDCWKEIDAIAAVQPVVAARRAARFASACGGESRLEALWKNANAPYEKIMFYSDGRGQQSEPADVEGLAQAYVACTSNPPAGRVAIVLARYCRDSAPAAVAARQAIADIDMKALKLNWIAVRPVDAAFQHADWRLTEELLARFGANRAFAAPRFRRMRMIALAADGNVAAALKLAREGAADDALATLDRAKFVVSAALLAGEDVDRAIGIAALPRKDLVELVRTAARQALTWGMNDQAEALSRRYAAFFVEYPQREQKVVYSDEPILSISDWRRLYPTLDKQFIDRRWGARMDILDTDVATGRELVEKTDKDSRDAKMELSSVCDVTGLHLFLRVEDPNARAVEEGFAGGIGTEMYFAPGLYEPYACFGSSPRAGVRHAFQTAYDSLTNKRVDYEGTRRPDDFRSEVAFTDADYVLHLFFAWDTFYDKLPSKTRPWRFECIAFTPAGQFSWGGSLGVHNSSCWGNLVFDLKPEELTAIRRRIICRTVKGWRTEGKLDTFDKWADEEIGDPAFYAEELAPIERELSDFAKDVKVDMTDEDVNRIYEKALPQWKGLKHVIDARRRIWLMRRATSD